MIFPPDPGERGNILRWAIAAQKYLRDLDRRINSILPSRPQQVEEVRKAVSAASHPFKVLTRSKPGNANIVQAKVILGSSLYLSKRPNHKYPITGLDEWFDLIATDAIWLGIVFDGNGVPTFAGIDSWGKGDSFQINKDAWSGENGYCEDDGGSPAKFQTARKLIAITVAGDDGKPVLEQKMFHDQVLEDFTENARYARLPVTYEGGYQL